MRNLIIISAPSGSGKTTICKEIQKKDPQIKFSISHTSRSMRSNEEDGVDYFFIDHLKFQNFISNDYFIEWEKIQSYCRLKLQLKLKKSYYSTFRTE